MSDLEAKIKITVENGTAAGFNQAANSAESASKVIENAINNVKARLKTHFDDMQKSMEKAFHVNPSTFKNLGDAQEGMFNKISSSARKVYEETRTPMEQFKAKLAEVNQLLNLGAIDVETYERKVGQLNSELEQTDSKASAAAGGLGKIGSVLAGFASLSFAKSMLDTADAMQSINAQVRQVVSSESEYLAVQRQLLDVANNTRASLESTANLYVSTSRALKDYGYTQQEILTFAAMAAIMAAVMGLMGGGGGSQTTTTTTRIPSAAGGWDIPAGINPLTQLHENEMVLPAEHAQTIREMAGQSGGDDSTIIINSTGGDFIHKKDLAKLLKQMKRDFKFV